MAQMKRDKKDNGPQNITQEAKDRVTQTPLKSRGELRCCRNI
jgi:hypothetical protein